MSNTQQSYYHDEGAQATPFPRAVIHKRILDAAENRPEESVEKLAASVSGASVSLVERVLETYGDPAPLSDGEATEPSPIADSPPTEETPSAETSASTEDAPKTTTSSSAGDSLSTDALDARTHGSDAAASLTESVEFSPAPEETQTESGADATELADERTETAPSATEQFEALTRRQQETLAVLAEHPNTTQRELADMLGVSCATINRRVNSIDGFDWENRREFITRMFDTDTTATDASESPAESMTTARESAATSAETDIRRRLDADRCESVFDDPELAHKILHACMASDRISEEEELRIVQHALSTERRPE